MIPLGKHQSDMQFGCFIDADEAMNHTRGSGGGRRGIRGLPALREPCGEKEAEAIENHGGSTGGEATGEAMRGWGWW